MRLLAIIVGERSNEFIVFVCVVDFIVESLKSLIAVVASCAWIGTGIFGFGYVISNTAIKFYASFGDRQAIAWMEGPYVKIRQIFKITVKILLVCGVINALIPSKNYLLMIAASEVSERIINSDAGKKISDDVTGLSKDALELLRRHINDQLRQSIEQQQVKKGLSMKILILGKFMPFHNGHAHLLQFAIEYSKNIYQITGEQPSIHIVVGTQPDEPIAGNLRYHAVRNWIERTYAESSYVYWLNKKLPQYPSEHENFWQIWHDELTNLVGTIDVVIASESYGIPLAEKLRARFVPFDPTRSIVDISGTELRDHSKSVDDPQWLLINCEMRRYLRKPIVLFGNESVGKTFVSQQLATKLHCQLFPEYARTYLTDNNDLTEQKWVDIIAGQAAYDSLAQWDPQTRIQIKDTDLISTYGWLQILEPILFDKHKQFLETMIQRNCNGIYMIMCISGIEFQPDPLRYGGDRRMTDDQFWINMLDQFSKPYLPISGKNRLILVENWISSL